MLAIIEKRTVEKYERAVAVGMTIVLVSLAGCVTEASKGASAIGQDQVREHSEKVFDKLKEEETNRASGSAVDPR